MPLHIVIDARRVRDFGIGTYIRSLVQRSGAIDPTNQYTLVTLPATSGALAGLPPNFSAVTYARTDLYTSEPPGLPAVPPSPAPHLVHIPLNRVPLFMPRALRGDRPRYGQPALRDRSGAAHRSSPLPVPPRIAARQPRHRRFRRHPPRRARTAWASPPDRIRLVYNAPDPGFLQPTPQPASAPAHPGALPDRLSVPALRRQHPPAQEHAAPGGSLRGGARATGAPPASTGICAWSIIGDNISQYPAVRQAVIRSRVEQVVRFLGFVPFETLRVLLSNRRGLRFSLPLRRFRPAAAGSHGLRHAGGGVQRQLAAGSGGRRRHAGESRKRLRYRARHPRRAARRRSARRSGRRGRPKPRASVGSAPPGRC